MKINRAKLGSRLVFIGLALFVLFRLDQEMKRAPDYGAESTYDAEERVNFWLLSALCFQKTHVPLVLCVKDDRIIPMEAVSLADDRGHTLLLTLASFLHQTPITRESLVKINLCINAVGILLLACMWRMVKMPWTALLCMGLGSRFGLPGPVPGHDAPASYFGIFCLAAVALVWSASFDTERFSKVRIWMASVLSVVSLAAASMLRQPIGLIGAITSFLLLTVPWSDAITDWHFYVKKLAVGGVLIALCLNATPAVLKWRNVAYKIPDSGSYHSHGIWHTLYLGLGWVPNPWGIRWDDQYGADVVSRIDPQAQYGTTKYFRLMRGLYWHLLATEPLALAKIYARKFEMAWNFTFMIGMIRLSRWFVFLSVLALAVLRKAVGPARYPLKMVLALGVLYFLYFTQGVLAIPTGTHLYPLKFCVLLMMAVWADFAWVVISTMGTPAGRRGGGDRRPEPSDAGWKTDPAK